MKTLLLNSAKGEAARSQFRAALLEWYDANQRSLPWRRTRQPFRIWVSEIMLQQTRVAAVLLHYKKFLRQFPTVQALARAGEQQVLAAWSGLGYYRRARMLHRAAKEVVEKRQGRIPGTSQELQSLPGIGRYTAAAIASIAFGQPEAVVDGNVERVLSRIAGKQLSAKSHWECAQQLMERSRPGDFNQAMMELGATICLPQAPLCKRCPVTGYCQSRGNLRTKKTKSRQQSSTRQLMLARRKNSILLQQRSQEESVMPGMWDLPEHHGPQATPVLKVRHSIMNTCYEVRVFAHRPENSALEGKWVALSRLDRIPLTGTTRKVLRKLGLLD
ncbi:MAG TPA: A/G-specific adenine glycosylase [Terriglobales bacterium]